MDSKWGITPYCYKFSSEHLFMLKPVKFLGFAQCFHGFAQCFHGTSRVHRLEKNE